MVTSLKLSLALLLGASSALAAASCPGAPAPAYPLRVASGWSAMPVLGSLTRPRGVAVDTKGNLLVLERGKGITAHTVDGAGCVEKSKVVVDDPNLNHGIAVHEGGKKLFASTPDVAYEWDYDAGDMEVKNRKELITGMLGPGQNTRTLLASRKHSDYLVVSVGSGSNIDDGAFVTSTGRAQIRSFNTKNIDTSAAFTDDNHGKIMAFGMRNSVGIAEDREGTIHSVDNSVDDAYRVNIVTSQVVDIHQHNPAEKAYTLGDPTNANASFFGGAPYCYTVYNPADITDQSLKVGDYFALQPNSTFNDAWCQTNAAKPSLVLPPHVAPLDMKFGTHKDDNNLYIGLHGSYNADTTVGYKVIVVPGEYSGGRWVPASGVQTPSTDLLANQNEANCGTGCFRPVGLAFGEDGEHLYVSSDTSGEVFLVKRGNGAFGGFKNHPSHSVLTLAVALPALVWALL